MLGCRPTFQSAYSPFDICRAQTYSHITVRTPIITFTVTLLSCRQTPLINTVPADRNLDSLLLPHAKQACSSWTRRRCNRLRWRLHRTTPMEQRQTFLRNHLLLAEVPTTRPTSPAPCPFASTAPMTTTPLEGPPFSSCLTFESLGDQPPKPAAAAVVGQYPSRSPRSTGDSAALLHLREPN